MAKYVMAFDAGTTSNRCILFDEKGPVCVETTAMGAAYLAGLAVGYWKNKEEVLQNWEIDKNFEPEIASEVREKRIKGWNKAVKYAYGWAKEEF